MKNYDCTCPVCRIAHTVKAISLSSPRDLRSLDGRTLPAVSCGAHTREEVAAARWAT